MAGFCGPGSLMLLGFLALIAPCGGSLGLPKAISLFTGVASAVLIVAAAIAPLAAVAANMSRLENMVLSLLVPVDLNNCEIAASFWCTIKLKFRTVRPHVCCQAIPRPWYWWRHCDGCDPRSFGSRLLSVPGRCLLLLFSVQPALQPVEIDINNRRRIKRENLRQSEAAHDGIAE